MSVDIESLITEDDTPVDNMPSEKQQRLLTEPLYLLPPGFPANVGVFPERAAIVPDVFLSMDVQVADNFWDKRHRSYFVWEFGAAGPGGGDPNREGRGRAQAAQVRAHGGPTT